MTVLRKLIIGFAILLLIHSISYSTDYQSRVQNTFAIAERDYWPTEEWRNASAADHGFDEMYLEAMMQDINNNGHNIHSVLIIHDGYLVWEKYPSGGYGPTTLHMLQSVTKSFSSTLIGIALQQGLLDNTSQRMVDLFSDWTIGNMDTRKESITLEHLLTMTDGMDWHETDLPYDHPNNTLGQMWVSDDAVQHVLDRPMARDPGESWFYNSGTSILLGGILEEVTGQDVKDFAREHLFDPIGIGPIIWYKTTGNHYHTDGGLYMTPRDMARLGFLMLNNGTWDGNEIVSSEWVYEATRIHAMTPWTQGYGYQWWTFPDYGVYAATGHYEQKIYVIPEHDTVVVFTANIADEDPHPTDYFVFAYILPSMEVGSLEEVETLDELVNSSLAVLLVVPLAMAVIFWVFKIRQF